MSAAPSRFKSLAAFRYPAYRLIWTGAFLSNIGSWVQTVSVGVYATETTGKAAWTGIMAALGYLPAVVLGPWGGALADRVDRRRFVLVFTVVQALCAAALSVMAFLGHLPLAGIGALVFISGCAGAVSAPAFNAVLSEIVDREDLLSALSLTAGQFNLARTIGPTLAAIILTTGGIKLSFAVNAASYLAVLLAVAVVRLPARPRFEVRGNLLEGILAGIRVARDDPGIRLSLLLVLAIAMLVAPFIGLIPAHAIQSFGRGAAGASMLVTSQGVGALVAALFANALAARWGVRGLMVRALTAVAPAAACYWLAPTYAVAFAFLAPLGGIYLWSITSLSTTCMSRVSRDIQARINSLYSVTLSGGYALGLVVQGWLADRFGLRVVPVVAAGLLLLTVLLLRRRQAFAAVDSPSEYGGAIQPVEAET